MNYQTEYSKWLDESTLDAATRKELKSLSEDEIKLRFSGYMEFGTAGLRSTMGAGTACMNPYTVAHATEGLARYILKTENGKERGVAVCYDSRNHSREYAERSAEVLSAHGIRVFLFSELRPTPVLSFAVRHFGCIAGINVTASHNPSEYNGYKVYWEDGAQLSPEQADAVSAEIKAIDLFRDVPPAAAANRAIITMVGKELDEAYIREVLAQAVDPDALRNAGDSFAVIYTPLYGTGGTLVPTVLERAGLKNLKLVEKQMVPNGDFPGLRYPNPEFAESFFEGQKEAEAVGSDLIIATDPDADRVGVMARDKNGTFRCITGNQMGGLLLDYIIRSLENRGIMPAEPYAVKSIVSSELATMICEKHKVRMYNVLTGFKFIGEVIKKHEESGRGTFLLGFEESYGYLKGTYARDKDAVVTTMLIAEMAAVYKRDGLTLIDALERLFSEYGSFHENVFSIMMEGLGGKEKMKALMSYLRKNPLLTIGGLTVSETRDYLSQTITDNTTGTITSTGLPSSDVLYYKTSGGNVLVIRPSGTEPKVKVYILANGRTDAEAAEISEKMSTSAKAILG